jgi:hypothetical protein
MSEWDRLGAGALEEAGASAGAELGLVCAWCTRVFSDGIWTRASDFTGRSATHGICPDCMEPLLAPSRTRIRERGSRADVAMRLVPALETGQ